MVVDASDSVVWAGLVAVFASVLAAVSASVTAAVVNCSVVVSWSAVVEVSSLELSVDGETSVVGDESVVDSLAESVVDSFCSVVEEAASVSVADCVVSILAADDASDDVSIEACVVVSAFSEADSVSASAISLGLNAIELDSVSPLPSVSPEPSYVVAVFKNITMIVIKDSKMHINCLLT